MGLQVQANVPEKKNKEGVIEQAAIGPFIIEIDCPENAKGLIEAFGDEAVYTNAIANWKVTIQGNMRAGMKRGETQQQLQDRLKTAKMGVAQKGVKIDTEQAFVAMFASSSPERQAELLADLKSQIKGK